MTTDQTAGIGIYTTLDALPASALALLDDTGARSFYLSRAWFENYLTEIHDQARNVQILCHQGDDNDCLLLTYRQQRRHFGLPIPYLVSLTNFYSSDYAPICSSPDSGFSGLLQAISDAGARPVAFDLAYLQDGLPFERISDALRQHHYAVFPYQQTVNWFEPIAAGSTAADYLAARPGKLRSTLQRRRRKLARDHASEIRIITGTGTLEAAIADYETIYAKSWKESESYPGFMPGLMRATAAQGWLRLGLLYIDGVPAAAQIWITQGGIAHIFKLAYDPAFKAYSPGTILTAKMADYAIETDQVSGIDFLNGDDAYKRDWMSQKRLRRGILAVDSRRIRGRLFIAAKALKARLGGHR